MSRIYNINDIFYSLQGEGHNVGRAAIFVRFSGCNLTCPFCDTDYSKYTGMTGNEIVNRIKDFSGGIEDGERPIVVLTGGEPTLQADWELILRIHECGFKFVTMESNGTNEPPSNLDWLTVSPKAKPVVKRCNELKVLFDGKSVVNDYNIKADYYYLQPLDTGNVRNNDIIVSKCVNYIKEHPRWRLSLQTHKMIGIK